MRREPSVHSLRRAAPLAILALAMAATAEPHDASYWIGRMEAALLPQSSLRTDASIVTKTRLGLEEKADLHVVRIQGPERLRTLLAIQEEGEPPRIERVEFDGNAFRRSVFQPGFALPVDLPTSRSQHVGETEFTYEDLAFADFAPWKNGSAQRRSAGGSETIDVTAKGYEDYGKVTVLLNPKTALPIEVLYFRPSGQLFRTLRFSQFEKNGSDTFPTRAVAENLSSGRTSSLALSNTVIGPPIYEAEFSDVDIQKQLKALQGEATPETLF